MSGSKAQINLNAPGIGAANLQNRFSFDNAPSLQRHSMLSKWPAAERRTTMPATIAVFRRNTVKVVCHAVRTNFPRLERQPAKAVDRIVTAFEQVWQNGSEPRLESYLRET